MYNEKGVYPDTIPLKRNDKAPTAGNYSYFFIKPNTNAWQEVSELEKEAGKYGAVLALPTKRGLLITIANSDDEHFKEVYKELKTVDITKDIGAFQDKNPNASINYVLTNVLKEDERDLDFEFNIDHLGYNPEEVRNQKLGQEHILNEDQEQNENNSEIEAEEVLSKIETASDKKTKLSVLKDWMAEHKQKRIEQKAFDKWASGVEKAMKLDSKIKKYEEQLKEQKKIIKEQNELLHGHCSFIVNGKKREVNNGLMNAFPNAVKRLDEANRTIQVLSQNQSLNKSFDNSNGIEM